MRKILAHVLGAALILGISSGATGCVIRSGKQPKEPAAIAPAKPAKATPAPAATAKPQLTFETENGALKLPGPVMFESGKGVIKPESDVVLNVVKDYLNAKPQVTLLRIEGHTDSVGVAADNQKLSELRSMAVAQWLIANGIRCNRLLPVGFGQDKPIASNTTDEGRSQNRRTMFINAELKGKAIGGAPTNGGGIVAGDPCR